MHHLGVRFSSFRIPDLKKKQRRNKGVSWETDVHFLKIRELYSWKCNGIMQYSIDYFGKSVVSHSNFVGRKSLK